MRRRSQRRGGEISNPAVALVPDCRDPAAAKNRGDEQRASGRENVCCDEPSAIDREAARSQGVAHRRRFASVTITPGVGSAARTRAERLPKGRGGRIQDFAEGHRRAFVYDSSGKRSFESKRIIAE